MRTLITISTLIFTLSLLGQESLSEIQENKKYVVWISPSNATHMHGLMINFFPQLKHSDSNDRFPIIYGSELNLNPIGLFTPFILLIHSIDPETHGPLGDDIDSLRFDYFKKINGLQIGLINMEPSIINGLDINVTGSFESKSNGVTLSLVMNKHYIANGVTIALIGNHDIKCNGLQVGLINSAKDLKGFQIGLWNKNQKRSLPIINWNFK